MFVATSIVMTLSQVKSPSITMVTLNVFLISVCVLAVAAEELQQPIEILTERTSVDENGYSFEFKTSDGVSRKEEAQLITVGENQGIGVKGSYSYITPDGQQYIVNFTADDKGFKPEIRVAPASSQ